MADDNPTLVVDHHEPMKHELQLAASQEPKESELSVRIDAFGLTSRPTPSQPIPFPHKIHLEKKAVCTDCHESVEKGPVAGIPSVKTCMICHSQIATDKPLIKEVTAYSEKGVEIPWQRVYGFTHEAHVRFNHAPHVARTWSAPRATATSPPRPSLSASSITTWASA